MRVGRKKIKYCDFTIHNKTKVLSSDIGDRSSEVEEHVDAAPPDLNEENWADTSVKTLGYLSLDQGKSWIILTVDRGFEGLGFKISRVGKKQFIYDNYHYISH
jgi:hypothetical protein